MTCNGTSTTTADKIIKNYLDLLHVLFLIITPLINYLSECWNLDWPLTFGEEMLFVNICGQTKRWTLKAALLKVLIRKWLVTGLGTDGSCLLYESKIFYW